MAAYSTSFRLTSRLGRKAYTALLWRQHGVYIVSSFFIAALFIVIIPNSYGRPLACFGLGVISVFWYSWIGGLRQVRAYYKNLSDWVIDVNLEEEGITFITPDGTSSLQWRAFSRLYAMKNFWIFVRRFPSVYSLIPIESLNKEARDFIKRKITEARVNIL
jgi:hypothetical protein